MCQRHADYFLCLAEEAEPHLTGAEQGPWLDRLQVEHENFRLSLDFLRHAGHGAEELRLVGALTRYWYVRGHLREGSSRSEEALAAHDDQSQPRLKALFGAALLAHRLGDDQRADTLHQERLVLARLLEDTEAVAISLIGLGLSAQGLGDHERRSVLHRERGACARGRLHLDSRGGHRQPGRFAGGAGRLRAGKGSSRKPTNSSAGSATKEARVVSVNSARRPSRGPERRG